MKKLLEYVTVFAAGSLIYSSVELLWRGNTHWSMTLTGGMCFAVIYLISADKRLSSFWVKCIISAVSVSIIEFNVGCIVNILLGWSVWDYSDIAYNLMGQVCPLYSFFWFLLSIPALFLCRIIRKIFQSDAVNTVPLDCKE